ncbi:MAG: DNA translocase FtsK 4TM domain-containing protein [Rikenellaceae bacterium]
MARVNTTKGATNQKSAPSKSTASKPVNKNSKVTGNEPKEQAIGWPILALVLFFVSIILLIACISFFFTWQEDQSIALSSLAGQTKIEAVNVCGRMGAIVSRVFIRDWFGVFGILMPLVLTTFAAYIIAVKKDFIFKTLTIIFSTSIIGSVSACYFFSSYEGIFGSTMGGSAGYAIHILLQDVVGDIGELFILIMLICILLVYISRSIFPAIFRGFVIFEGLIKLLYGKFSNSRKERARRIKEKESQPVILTLDDDDDFENSEQQPIVSINDLIASDNDQVNGDFDQQVDDFDQVDHQNYHLDEQQGSTEPVYFGYSGESDVEQGDYDENIDDIQEEYSEQIDEFNRSIGVIETEDSFKIEPTIIGRSETPFLASETPINSENSETSANMGMYAGGDMVVLDPSFFVDLPEEAIEAENDDFEVFTKEKDGEKDGESSDDDMIIFAKDDIKEDVVEKEIAAPVKPVSKPAATIEEFENEGFTVERANSNYDEDDFEVAVTDNADLDIDDDELALVKINVAETFDDKDIDDSIFDPTLSLSRYKLPTVDLMDNHTTRVNVTKDELLENNNRIRETLGNFNIKIDKIKATIGPTVTLYEIVPAPGVRISKIKNLEDDIALSLSALGIRIIAPIPGKGTVGIEVPNKDKETVSMYSVIKSVKFQESDAELPIVLGRTVQNEDYVIDLAKAPHMLVAGATGQGKSVGLNAIITSLLYKKHPAELKFVFVDPKKVELTLYSLLERHFLAKLPDEDEAIITDTQKVVYTLNSMCSLMDTRYDILKLAKVRNVKEYNDKFKARKLNPNKGHEFMPYFVVIIDEFADLIMTAGREVETPIARLAQLGRATGIHLVIATQRPTTNIITGVIKANFPTRVAFRVSSMIDSRTILDQPGANQLIGRGDMLISNGNDTTRVQCAFIDTPEVERICEFISKQTGYGEAYELPEFIEPVQEKDSDNGTNLIRRDGLFTEVARYVVTSQQGSTSTIQRNFSIGFNRAGRIMDQLEKAGIVGKTEGSKPRKVLVSDIASLEVMLYDMEHASPNF